MQTWTIKFVWIVKMGSYTYEIVVVNNAIVAKRGKCDVTLY